MAITKTKFIEWTRCPRYVALEEIKKSELANKVSFSEYKEEERNQKIRELLSLMYDGNIDLIDKENEHLNAMMPYYREVERLAAKIAPKYFDGTFTFSEDTEKQESFDFWCHGHLYQCFVDIYNEHDDHFRVIEVKATTSSKFLSLGTKTQSIFEKGNDGIYYLKEELGLLDLKKTIYQKEREKLKDRFHSAGHYVYDLAVQRYMIEQELKKDGMTELLGRNRYYLAVLSHTYIYDGKQVDGKNVYETDSNGNDIIVYFDMTKITKELQPMIEQDRKRLESWIERMDASFYPVGRYCEYKKTVKCKYCPICFHSLPKKNSVFHYIDAHYGFRDEQGKKVSVFDLVNQGITELVDVPDGYLTRKKNQIQKEVVTTHQPYVDIEKIKAGLDAITYPVYHLDFETFPCPLPRYKGEKCYTQSVFQFSLHIEKEKGVCDKEKDHVEYLAKTSDDCRLELVKKLCDAIDTKHGGTVLVYNESFEKGRLLELANLFLEYREKLLEIHRMVFDLMAVIKGNSKLYERLGFPDDSLYHYYHEEMSGSFSIKKILPLFSSLSYQGMEIGNGVDALVAYANYDHDSLEERMKKQQKLIEYCKQDTWAMVEILNGISKSVN